MQDAIDLLKIQTDSSHDELIRRKPAVNHICVIDDVTAENEATTNCIDEIHCVTERNENPNDAGHHCWQE